MHPTITLGTSLLSADQEGIACAQTALSQGEIVAFPTETVYGLGARADSTEAISRIYTAKGRPLHNPLIAHYVDATEAAKDVDFSPDAWHLARLFWPGPLTMVLPCALHTRVCASARAGLPTLAVRVPAHPLARALLAGVDFPVAAPSANRSGRISPTTPAHVAAELSGRIPYILAGGFAACGIESTILDLSGDVPVLLRPGAITIAALEDALEKKVESHQHNHVTAPKSPGLLERHYAPDKALRLNAVDVTRNEALLAFGSVKFMGIREGGFARDLSPACFMNLSESGDLREAAANLYRMLRALDNGPAESIAVMAIPDMDIGAAINDRLRRAAKR